MLKCNVLIIDDHQFTAEVIGRVLETSGYGAHLVTSRNQALEQLDRYIYKYILIDYHMPGMPVRQFVDLVREKCPNSKLILMTGKTAQERAYELGISDYVQKPFDPSELPGWLESAREIGEKPIGGVPYGHGRGDNAEVG